MLEEKILALLRQVDGPRSGGEMSRMLGVSRTMVWRGVEALRAQGYQITSAPRRGYRLVGQPDLLEGGRFHRAGGEPVVCLETVDSTNNECKRRALLGAPDGLAVVSAVQTGGRGRRGRGFVSPEGGLYLSMVLRPDLPPQEIAPLTAWVAVAASWAVEDVTGLRPGVKWPNDLILLGRKLCGILTELALVGETGELDYLVVGVGINLTQRPEDWPPELAQVAISLGQAMAQPPRRDQMAQALLTRLDALRRDFPGNPRPYLDYYRENCVNLGKHVRIIGPNGQEPAFADGVSDTFALLLQMPDGTRRSLTSGEVSVRNIEGAN